MLILIIWKQQGQLVDLVQKEVKALLQSALEVALSIVRANHTVVEGLGAQLEGNCTFFIIYKCSVSVFTVLFSSFYIFELHFF